MLRSNRELRRGDWFTVSLSRDLREARLLVNDDPVITQRIHGISRPLNLQTHLYVGGYDTQKVHLGPGMNVDQGFTGCISEVRASNTLIIKSSIKDKVSSYESI